MAEADPRIAPLKQKFTQTPFSRAHDRLKFEEPVSVEILIPEDTFQPHRLEGFTLNVSVQGMQVVLEKMESQLYSRMLANQRMARVYINHPSTNREISVMGKIAWIDFRKAAAGASTGDCSLGIAFSEKLDGVDLTEYSELIEEVKQSLRHEEPRVRILEL